MEMPILALEKGSTIGATLPIEYLFFSKDVGSRVVCPIM